MRVELIKQFYTNELNERLFRYKVKNIDYCCDEIKNNYNNHLINLAMKNKNVCLGILGKDYDIEDIDDEISDTYHPIKFCPFCGSFIDIVIVDEEDITSEYQKIWKEKELLERLLKEEGISEEKKKEIDIELCKYQIIFCLFDSIKK